MSFLSTSEPVVGKAEAAFREAFVRLCLGCPIVLPKGTPLSQNNVAKEAGRDPSALKKDRYPALIREVQEWIAGQSQPKAPSVRQELKAARRKNQLLKQRIGELKADRDLAQSQLVQAHAKILELAQEVSMLRAASTTKVSPLTSAR